MLAARPWDLFCHVIDNYGDVGVCWRLAVDLAQRGIPVRLWIDDDSALQWMAPGAQQGRWAGIQVLPWKRASDAGTLATLEPAAVWIEAFGCELPDAFVAHGVSLASAGCDRPVWINLEYLSAERFAQRAHGLASPVLHGVARGWTKFFYYPGFTPGSGGLLRESDLGVRRQQFDRSDWLAARGIGLQGERLVSLFCYEPQGLSTLLTHWRQGPRPTRLLVTAGRATAAVHAAAPCSPEATRHVTGQLAIDFLAPLSQLEFDHLLWACDLNLVRGEDSVIRALWAARPFVWQIYPQHDAAHHAKLEAFLEALAAPDSIRLAHHAWNGITPAAPSAIADPPGTWGEWASETAARLRQQNDLVTRLLAFVQKMRQHASRPAGKS